MPIYHTLKENFRVWSEAEVRNIIENCDPRLAPIIAAAWITGARIGEIMNMKSEDVIVVGDEVKLIMMTEKVAGRPLREYTLSTQTPLLMEFVIGRDGWTRPKFGVRRAEQMLMEGSIKAGSRVVFHEFRHSRNTYIARVLRGSMSELMDWNGWKTTSQIGTYLIRESPKRFKDMIK